VSRIDGLIEEERVKWSTLGDICTKVSSGGTPSSGRADYYGGDIPWLRTQEVNYVDIKSTGMTITEEGFRNSSAKWIPAHCVIVAMYGATAAKVAINEIPLTTNQACCNLQIDPEKAEYRYVFYWVANEYERLKALGEGSQSNLNAQKIKSFPIPLPSLQKQREIVRRLDSFGALETELKAELEARQIQYSYYGGLLLTFSQDIPRKPLGQLATVVRGASPRPIQSFLTDEEDGVPWIKIGDVARSGKYITGTGERVTEEGAAKSRRVHPGDFVLSNSMSFGRPYISKIEGCIHDGWLAISDFNSSFVVDFLYHLLRSDPVQNEFSRRAGEGAVRNLNADIVKAVELPVPSLVDQKRIADTLDTFDLLVNDSSVGIPAELNARRKQYEYYRDRLLTFEELPV
jgi:type I restriction enzyme, S subunit